MGSDISTARGISGSPKKAQVHPSQFDSLDVVIRKLGKKPGFYFIHKGKEGPKSGNDHNNMWLWIKKTSISKIRPTVIRIENFTRGIGHSSTSPRKGQTLITATLARIPTIDQFQRVAGTSRDEFKGFLRGGYSINEDFFYTNHPLHKCKKRRQVSFHQQLK